MTSTRIAFYAATLACGFASGASAQGADPQTIVDAQFKLGGDPKMARASGAKGTCVKGAFTPTAEARGLSKAPHFAKAVPVTARFSMGGGNPNISDKAKGAVRGFAMRFGDPSGDMVFVFISAPVFFAKTPEQMLSFVTVRLPGADGKPADPEKIKAFSTANPETTRQGAWLSARPVPASFAGVDYWGVQAYTLTNAKAEGKIVRLKAVASAGQLGLTDAELAAMGTSFYADELKARLGKGPAAFDLVAILGEAGDPVNDSTENWPEDKRKTVKLGTISIAAVEPAATCDAQTFDPVVSLPDGVAGPKDDPMFAIRSPAYAVSLTRRAN